MAQKETRELYRGKAVIMGVAFEGVEDWKDWEKRDLPERDQTNAFKIVYDVAEGDAQGARHDVKVECSHRELKGKMLDYYKHEDGTTPTQMDVAIRSLVQQGILPKGAKEQDIGPAVDDALVGREVTIRAYEELGKDGVKWWPKCAFVSARAYISGADKAARLAAFLAGKPAPAATGNDARGDARAPQDNGVAANMPPAPADDEDIPF